MIIPPRSDGSPNLEAERFVAAAREGLALQTAAHTATWRFGEEDEWAADLETGVIFFIFYTDDGETRVSASIQVVGTYDNLDNSFLWAWDHPSVPESLRQHAVLARQWGERSDVPTFTERKLACSEDDAWAMAAVTARLAEANGVYRGPAGDAYVFFTFGELNIDTTGVP